MPRLPTGTVTFLFTDIEGSTALLHRLGDRRYAHVLAEHQRVLRDAFAKGNGREVDTQGDSFLVAFPRARDALTTAVAAQQALMQHVWSDDASFSVRMGLHTGEPVDVTGSYIGLDVHRAARISAAGHGGQILLSDAVRSLAARDLPPGVSLRDLGTHRLRDLPESEHLFQVVHPSLRSDFPPLKSLDVLPNNLPRQLTSFIGREREIAELKRLLSTTCLLTLTGAGGAGKTRLALQVATDLFEHYPDGVWLAELAPLFEPTLVPKIVASAVGIPEQPGRPLIEALGDYLRPRAPLLLLDNCEHVLEACAHLADGLLQGCPNLRIIATSRQALGIAGEMTYRVPSLSLPDPKRQQTLETLAQYEAVRLFVERAAFSRPGFQITTSNAAAVAQVVHRLDGIPLAIELAAARVKAVPVEVIAARLDDRFRLLTGGSRTGLPRQQTLRATLDWSYSLLSEQEQVLLRRLSVFAGGFVLDAAEKVCTGEAVAGSEILDLLTRLVDKSLVLFDERDEYARYRLMESVRQYGRERLQEAGEADKVQERHRDWYLALAEQAAPELHGPRQELWLERLETEHDNMRAALEWSTAEKDSVEAAVRLAGALERFWYLHGHWSEGRRWLEKVLALSSDVPPSALPRALRGAAYFAWHQGDSKRATALSEKGLALCQELGDKEGRAWAIYHLGLVAMSQRDTKRARALFEESLELCRELGIRWFSGLVLAQLVWEPLYHGEYERAKALQNESLALLREAGGKWGIAYALRNAGRVSFRQDDYERAAASFTESLVLCKQMGDKWVAEECLEGLAGVASAKGDFHRAARLFGAAEVWREILGQSAPRDKRDHDQCVASTSAALGVVAFNLAWAEGRAMTLEQAIEYALADTDHQQTR